MAFYVPGTEEKDTKKVIMSLQQAHEKTAENATAIAAAVVGPSSSTDNGFVVYDGTTGKLVKDHAATVAIGSEVSGLGTGVATFLGTPSSANLRSALTDETGTGVAVFATSPSLTTPVIAGITSGTPPAAGKVGEIISATVAVGGGQTLTTGVDKIWNSISLTAGIWLVGGTAGVIKTGGTTPTYTHMHSDHGNAITTIQTSPNGGATTAMHVTSNNENGWIIGMGVKPYNLSGAATINAVMLVDFTGGTCEAYGHLWGLRIA